MRSTHCVPAGSCALTSSATAPKPSRPWGCGSRPRTRRSTQDRLGNRHAPDHHSRDPLGASASSSFRFRIVTVARLQPRCSGCRGRATSTPNPAVRLAGAAAEVYLRNCASAAGSASMHGRERARTPQAVLRSGRPARPAPTGAGDLSALLPCARCDSRVVVGSAVGSHAYTSPVALPVGHGVLGVGSRTTPGSRRTESPRCEATRA